MRFRRAVPLIATIAVGAVAVGGVIVAGTADRDAGSAHWASAIASSSTARSLVISADSSLPGASSACGDLTGRPVVVETAQRIQVQVELVLRPIAVVGGSTCDPVRSISVVVRLRSSIGSRTLIDGTGARRGILFTDSMPSLRRLPVGLTLRGTDWDEWTGVFSRWWRNSRDQQVDLTIASPTVLMARYPAPAGSPRTASVHGATASLWRDVAGPPVSTVDSTVRWSPAPTRGIQLEVLDQAPHPFSEAEVLALARGIG